MRNTIVGIFIGISFGIVLGASVIAPRLTSQPAEAIGDAFAAIPVPETRTTGLRAAALWTVPSSDNAEFGPAGPLIERAFANITTATGGAVATRSPALPADAGGLAQRSLYEAIIAREVDAAIVDPGDGADLSPAFDLFGSSPFGPRPRELMAWLYAGGGNELLRQIHAERGLFAMPCAMATTSAAGWFRKAVDEPDDLLGLRMRIDGLAADAARKLGIETVSLEDNQLLAAFRTGRIDAAEISLPSVDRELALHEGAEHYLFPGWHEPATLLVLLMRQETWTALNRDRQRQIELACGDNVRHGIAETEAAQFDALRDMAGQGVNVSRLPDDVLAAFADAWTVVAEEHAGRDEAFEAVWRSLSAFREDYAIWNEISTF